MMQKQPRTPLKCFKTILFLRGLDKGGFHTTRRKHDTKSNSPITYIVVLAPTSAITTNIQSKRIEEVLQREKASSLLRGGMPFDVSKLYEERSRIVNILQNNGFYQINKEIELSGCNIILLNTTSLTRSQA